MGDEYIKEEHPDYDIDPEYMLRLDASKGEVSFFVYEDGKIVEKSSPLIPKKNKET